MRPEVYVGNLDALLRRLADEFSAEAERAMARRGFYAVALPGGSVAAHAFPALAALPLQWDRVHFFWVDERDVPPTDRASNYGVGHARWLGSGRMPSASIHRMPADGPDLAAAAVAYGRELTRVLGAAARLDFVLLGVGSDGHVASLFPGHPDLPDERRLVVPVVDAPKPPARRLTLTLPVLARAERVVFMAFGEPKAAAIHEAIEHRDSPLPMALLLRKAARSLVLVDEGAASRMGNAVTGVVVADHSPRST
jgi:6-phosphogluconolactonase